MSRKLITSDEAVPAKGQHRKPCSDCPFARKALHGWLGGGSVADWVASAKGDDKLECHVLRGAQCAGGATFRANICKRPRDPEALVLPPDRGAVFATTAEFEGHHERCGL